MNTRRASYIGRIQPVPSERQQLYRKAEAKVMAKERKHNAEQLVRHTIVHSKSWEEVKRERIQRRMAAA